MGSTTILPSEFNRDRVELQLSVEENLVTKSNGYTAFNCARKDRYRDNNLSIYLENNIAHNKVDAFKILDMREERSVDSFLHDRRLVAGNYLGVPGIFIIFNKSKNNKVYIGYNSNIALGIYNIFAGNTRGDIFHDYKNRDVFTFNYLFLRESYTSDWRKLKHDCLIRYRIKYKIYNKRI